MKVTDISKVLDLALGARKLGYKFNPLFTGDAGIGKSEICQDWAKSKGSDFGFIDLRLAYLESPDLVGLPSIRENKTYFNTPSFLPQVAKSQGLLLLEEPNRANPSVLNCLMQILTDRKIGEYTLPEGWIIAGVINPDNNNYDVSSMDTALKDRFEEYPVYYDKPTFIQFIKDHKWDETLLAFIESGAWTFKTPNELGDNGKYISPRTLSKLNAARKTGVDSNLDLHFETSKAILGTFVGTEFHKYCFEVTPVLASDWIANKKEAKKKIQKYCDDNYRGDLLNSTINSMVEELTKTITMDDVFQVAEILHPDLANSLIKRSFVKTESVDELKNSLEKYPNLKAKLKSVQKKEQKS